MSRHVDYRERFFDERSLVNEVSGLLVVAVIQAKGKLRAADVVRELNDCLRVNEKSVVNFPPSFLYPLMNRLVDVGILGRDDSKYYSVARGAKTNEAIEAGAESLENLLKKIINVLRRAQ